MQESQSNLEEKVNPGILKDDFSLTIDLSNFTSIATVLLDLRAIIFNRQVKGELRCKDDSFKFLILNNLLKDLQKKCQAPKNQKLKVLLDQRFNFIFE